MQILNCLGIFVRFFSLDFPSMKIRKKKEEKRKTVSFVSVSCTRLFIMSFCFSTGLWVENVPKNVSGIEHTEVNFSFCKRKKIISSFQPSVEFHVGTSQLFRRAKEMTGFYMKRNIGQKWVKIRFCSFLHSYWVKSVRIRSFSGPYFPAFGLNTRDTPYLSVFSPNLEDTDQKNAKYGHFSRYVKYMQFPFSKKLLVET